MQLGLAINGVAVVRVKALITGTACSTCGRSDGLHTGECISRLILLGTVEYQRLINRLCLELQLIKRTKVLSLFSISEALDEARDTLKLLSLAMPEGRERCDGGRDEIDTEAPGEGCS